MLIDNPAKNSCELASGAKLAITVGNENTTIAGDILASPIIWICLIVAS